MMLSTAFLKSGRLTVFPPISANTCMICLCKSRQVQVSSRIVSKFAETCPERVEGLAWISGINFDFKKAL